MPMSDTESRQGFPLFFRCPARLLLSRCEELPTTELSIEWARGNSIGSTRSAYIRLYVGTGLLTPALSRCAGEGERKSSPGTARTLCPRRLSESCGQRRWLATIVGGARERSQPPCSSRGGGRSSCRAALRTQRRSTARPRLWRGVVNTRGMRRGALAFGWTRSGTAWAAPPNSQSNLTKRPSVPTHAWSGARNATASSRPCRGVVKTRKSGDAFVSRVHPNTESSSRC